MLEKLRALFGGRLEREMNEEMRAHIEQATARLIARGMSPKDAAIEARREFGNVTAIEEDARDARGTRWAESIAGDIRFAVRYIKRHKLAATTIVLVLALGIGVNSAFFSVIQAFTMRPAPGVVDDDRLIQVFGVEQEKRGERWHQRGMSYGELQALAARTETFSSIAGYTHDAVVLSSTNGSEGVPVHFVTPNYFAVLGVSTVAGRGLRASSDVDAAEMDAVIAQRIWERHFARSDSAIGSVLIVNGVGVRVVGVAPQGFVGPSSGGDVTALWLPISARATVMNVSRAWHASLDTLRFTTFGRLADGVDTEQATLHAARIAPAANASRASSRAADAVWSAHVYGLRSWEPMKFEEPDAPLLIAGIWGMALLVLLVACTNVSSLLVASAVERRHEIAVRLSLGASRARVVRQLVTESSMLAVAGGMAGLLLYWAVIRVLSSQIPTVDLSPDLGTLAFTMVFALGTGILFGLAPALHATGTGLATAVKDSGPGMTRRSRLQSGFVVAQIALTQPMLFLIAGQMWFNIARHRRLPDEDVGSRIAVVSFETGSAPQRTKARGTALRLAEEPGVVAVVPEASSFLIRKLHVASGDRATGPRAGERIDMTIEGAAPGFFAISDTPILLGRDVQLSDTLGREPAVVIPSDLARAFWGDADPIGRRLESDGWPKRGETSIPDARATMVVVGVYDANKPTTRSGSRRIYTAYGGRWRRDIFLLKTSGPADALVPRLRTFLRAEAPDVPVYAVETLNARTRSGRRSERQASAIAGGAAGLALLLASIGLFGAVALAVGQRRREIGVRIALGGRPLRVAGMFFTSGVTLSALGLVIGLPLSVVGVKLSSPQGMGVEFSYTLIAAAVAITVLTVASLATWLPARKAAMVDPAEALRVE